MHAFLNNKFVPNENVLLHASDLAISRGYAIFDYLKSMQGTPLYLDDHLERFYASAKELQLEVPFSPDELSQLVRDLINRNGLEQSGIRITLTGGYSEDSYTVHQPNFFITEQYLKLPGEEAFEKGIALITYEHTRQLPKVKTIDYVTAIFAKPLLKEQNADDLLYHHNGLVTECPRANFFIVTEDNKILTPAKGILHGITRKKLLEFKDVDIEETDIDVLSLHSWKEAFVTSTTKNVLPVLKINGHIISQTPGPVTRKLNALIQEFHQAEGVGASNRMR